jgi:hypothetical protein
MSINTSQLRISPAKAHEYLANNINNRPVRLSSVEQLAGIIERGEWRVTHQGIALDKTGKLLDGQHRLLAIIRANKAVDMLVTTGLDAATFGVIDCGRVRSFSDRIKLVDDERENIAACRIVRAYVFVTSTRGRLPTVDMLDYAYDEMPEAFSAVSSAFRKNIKKITRGGVGAALAVYIHKHKVNGRAFLQSLCSGEDLEAGSPILALREALIGDKVKGAFEEYWKTTKATRVHHDGGTMHRVSAATEDWLGNVFVRHASELSRRGYAAAETTKKQKKQGGAA